MLLAVDVGNTNIVLGCIEDGKIITLERMHTDTDATSSEYAIRLNSILALMGISPKAITGAIISSVVPQVVRGIVKAIGGICGIETIVVAPGMKTGLNVKIDDPGTLAGDLLVGSVAALTYYGAPAIVLDMGTATTLVVIDQNKNYIGGAILPGVVLGLKALSSGTSLLPDIALTAPKKCIATNTVDSMRSGAVYGTASMIDGMIDRFEEELGTTCKVVATGGLANSVTGFCKHDIIYDDDLLLKGLWILYQKNKK